MILLKKLSQYIKRQQRKMHYQSVRAHAIGQYTIQLPAGHRLDVFQQNCPRYDTSLFSILELHATKYPDMSVIDIGANIGDTAAIIRSVRPFPTVCIDGNPEFLPWLSKNTAQMGDQVFIESCFIGASNAHVNPASISNKNGTGNINQLGHETAQESGIELKPLEDIFSLYAHLPPFRLVKIDTDGFDFTILQGAYAILAEKKPSLFFEYDPTLAERGSQQSLDTIQTLVAIGYSHYVVYDNLGNYLLSIKGGAEEQFHDLNQFLLSSQTSQYGIDYLDVMAYHDVDADLHQQLTDQERQRKFRA